VCVCVCVTISTSAIFRWAIVPRLWAPPRAGIEREDTTKKASRRNHRHWTKSGVRLMEDALTKFAYRR
jgi:hypothetical protein